MPDIKTEFLFKIDLEVPPGDARVTRAHLYRGDAYFGKHDYLQAAREFRRVSDENPLDALAPDKDLVQISRSMRLIRDGIDEAREEHAAARIRTPPAFSPAGQATQMIVGATPATDRDILATASSLYTTERLRRVYYSAFSPIPDAPAREKRPILPGKAARTIVATGPIAMLRKGVGRAC